MRRQWSKSSLKMSRPEKNSSKEGEIQDDPVDLVDLLDPELHTPSAQRNQMEVFVDEMLLEVSFD